jgi:hypothetical protein
MWLGLAGISVPVVRGVQRRKRSWFPRPGDVFNAISPSASFLANRPVAGKLPTAWPFWPRLRAIGQAPLPRLPATSEILQPSYLRSPETFFGIVQHVARQANSTFEMVEFFYENFKNTSKATLLEILKDHPAIEGLRNLSQQELAVFVAEQWALGAEQQANRSKRTA